MNLKVQTESMKLFYLSSSSISSNSFFHLTLRYILSCREKQIMFGIFKKKTEKEKLQVKYEQLLKESFQLSKVDRTKSDAKLAEANAVMDQIDQL